MEKIEVGYPEQGGDAVNVRLIKEKVDLAVGGCASGAIQILIYGEDGVVASVEIKKMDKEEAPDVEQPYLVSIYDGDPGLEPDRNL